MWGLNTFTTRPISSFVTKWKSAVVIPLLKKQRLDPVEGNFHQVSNLTFMSQILGKPVIANYSTEIALLYMHYIIKRAM